MNYGELRRIRKLTGGGYVLCEQIRHEDGVWLTSPDRVKACNPHLKGCWADGGEREGKSEKSHGSIVRQGKRGETQKGMSGARRR